MGPFKKGRGPDDSEWVGEPEPSAWAWYLLVVPLGVLVGIGSVLRKLTSLLRKGGRV